MMKQGPDVFGSEYAQNCVLSSSCAEEEEKER